MQRVLNRDGAATDFAVGDSLRRERRRYDDGLRACNASASVCNECFARSQGGGLPSSSGVMSMMKARGLLLRHCPKSLLA